MRRSARWREELTLPPAPAAWALAGGAQASPAACGLLEFDVQKAWKSSLESFDRHDAERASRAGEERVAFAPLRRCGFELGRVGGRAVNEDEAVLKGGHCGLRSGCRVGAGAWSVRENEGESARIRVDATFVLVRCKIGP
jgi:hypothetical protein